MAIEDVTKFLYALVQDDDLAVQADDAYIEALHGVAAGAGYSFSEDDLRAGLDAAAGDLSDAELDQVVGGVTSTSFVSVMGSAQMETAFGGSVADTVFGGTSTSLVSQPSLTRFSSFSKSGFSR